MSDDDPTAADQPGRPAAEPAPGDCYVIRVRGQLSSRWATWFDGLTLTHEGDGTTVISGPVVDQAALHGLLQKLRDLGLNLLSLSRTPPKRASEKPDLPPDPTHPTAPGATP